MFIAMNRFQIIPGQDEAIEPAWSSRDAHLDEATGVVAFHRLGRLRLEGFDVMQTVTPS